MTPLNCDLKTSFFLGIIYLMTWNYITILNFNIKIRLLDFLGYNQQYVREKYWFKFYVDEDENLWTHI